ncbi:hypothetical protein OQA88_1956 [Cercophora sp. LCS_1]
MDRSVAVLLAFPEEAGYASNEEYQKAATTHFQKLRKLIEESSFAGLALQLLEHVDPAVNSMSYLALLQVILAHEKSPQTNAPLLSSITRFLLAFDDRQIRYVGGAMSTLLTAVGEQDIFPASIAVDLLTTALLKIDPTGSVLTSHHIALVQLAYTTDNIEVVLPILEKTVVFYPGAKPPSDTRLLCDPESPPSNYITVELGLTSKLNSSAVLRHDLLVALCFISRKSWQQALDTLERVISYPTKEGSCSKIMSEAYNKWLLVGLLLTGKTPSTPALTCPAPLKAYQTVGKPYASVAKAFENPSADVLKAEVETLGAEFWQEEGNLGLIKLVVSHYQRWKIMDLRDIYTKISLEQVRQLTQSAETGACLETEAELQSLIEDMISTGMLKGEIKPAADGKPAHLVFSSPTEDISEQEFASKMTQAAENIKNLAPIIRATQERLGTDKNYLRYLAGRESKGKGRDGGSADALGGFETQIEDEDLMTGIATNI